MAMRFDQQVPSLKSNHCLAVCLVWAMGLHSVVQPRAMAAEIAPQTQ